MKKLAYILLLPLLGLVSCDDFLTPRDKSSILEERLFTNREGVEEAMYGLYTQVGKASLYGSDIPCTMDILAQYHNPDLRDENSHSVYENLFLHKHDVESSKKTYSPIWSSLYQSIGYINNLIKNLDNYSGKTLQYMDLYRGECLGLRAFLHFDLLRMFGSPNLTKRGIPYVTEYGSLVTAFSSTGEVYAKIIADLKEAETLLAADKDLLTFPRQAENRYMPFTSYRTTHFNLYAAQAMLARVYWTRNQGNDLDSAAYYARQVIESGKFPLPCAEDNNQNTDYFVKMMAGTIAENEAIFGLYNMELYPALNGHYIKLQASFIPNDQELYREPLRGSDLRAGWIRKPSFASAAENDKYKSPRWMKLIDGSKLNDQDESGKGVGNYGSNQIRIPEMYLILAESLLEQNQEEARKYFNTLTTSRQLIPWKEELTTEVIDHEFQKEYACEGQYWFRLRRRQVPMIKLVAAIKDEGRDYIVMDEKKWTLSIPDEEFEYRDESTYNTFK